MFINRKKTRSSKNS